MNAMDERKALMVEDALAGGYVHQLAGFVSDHSMPGELWCGLSVDEVERVCSQSNFMHPSVDCPLCRRNRNRYVERHQEKVQRWR